MGKIVSAEGGCPANKYESHIHSGHAKGNIFGQRQGELGSVREVESKEVGNKDKK